LYFLDLCEKVDNELGSDPLTPSSVLCILDQYVEWKRAEIGAEVLLALTGKDALPTETDGNIL
jgi:hypothetical protein